ncbi:DUF3301 domain-containing protein [Saccharophagus degradans]|uniref:DUF3301 domain-containing protein n=1 Tax=Saccharophagus degradans TaxID=86304 RepID=A0AAW7X3A2_9GAMM|nr:DUF3301 domain-containing protein [Saccharophagus degradans]MBU2983770.1 DUF3301 domain-containing protein [Saccharophagus degradans]MDO6422256.1 DUF3301 domain-containing protein [Saccharophagus degradans]MDO6607469.1 DUF3301 domain-containing protein [Saccharophagus degradans]WGO97894.1 DUF3301 domain-containing protein [Saccharophagus degradans]
MTIPELTIYFLLAGLTALIWQHTVIGRRAYGAAKQHAEKQGVVLLDQSVILKRVRLVKSRHSLFAIERHFQFEFSTIGDTRYRGSVVFNGPRLHKVELQPFKTEQL